MSFERFILLLGLRFWEWFAQRMLSLSGSCLLKADSIKQKLALLDEQEEGT